MLFVFRAQVTGFDLINEVVHGETFADIPVVVRMRGILKGSSWRFLHRSPRGTRCVGESALAGFGDFPGVR